MANEKRIGALWYPKTQSEKAPFAKGEIEVKGEKIRIVVWKNHYKQPGDKKPDYQIELDRNGSSIAADKPNAEFTDDIPF